MESGWPMVTTYRLEDPRHSLQRAGRRRSGAFGSESEEAPSIAGLALPDDLSREVYCILGVPIDAIGMHAVLRRKKPPPRHKTRFLISTPNLNSFGISQSDENFR